MNFDEVLEQVRHWLGSEIAVVLWVNEFGVGESWLADMDGRLARIDDPIPDVDQPVHYVRFESGNGFALQRTWFKEARWKTVAEQRSLDVDLGAVSISLTPSSA
jgi:hypothetical protein